MHTLHATPPFPEDDEGIELDLLAYDPADPHSVRRVEDALMRRYGLARAPALCDDRPRGLIARLLGLGRG